MIRKYKIQNSKTMINVKLLSESATMPTKAHLNDAGWDLYSSVGGEILPGQRKLIPTSVSMAIPEGYYGRIADRSGNAYNSGVHVLAGVVDAGYRNEVKVLLINLSDKTFEFSQGNRVAQLVITAICSMPLVSVSDLDDTSRGAGGFGSSGR